MAKLLLEQEVGAAAKSALLQLPVSRSERHHQRVWVRLELQVYVEGLCNRVTEALGYRPRAQGLRSAAQSTIAFPGNQCYQSSASSAKRYAACGHRSQPIALAETAQWHHVWACSQPRVLRHLQQDLLVVWRRQVGARGHQVQARPPVIARVHVLHQHRQLLHLQPPPAGTAVGFVPFMPHLYSVPPSSDESGSRARNLDSGVEQERCNTDGGPYRSYWRCKWQGALQQRGTSSRRSTASGSALCAMWKGTIWWTSARRSSVGFSASNRSCHSRPISPATCLHRCACSVTH